MRPILGSGSSARARLLRAAGYRFESCASQIPETPPGLGRSLEQYVTEMARAKALAVGRRFPGAFVIGSDTAIAVGRRILGKPRTPANAVAMLELLCGRTHRIATGVCVATPHDGRTIPCRADADALQEDGAAIVERIKGDLGTVIGLPLGLVEQFLLELGYVPD